MANRDPPAKPVALRQVGHEMCIEARRIVTGINMHVDVDVILARDFEDPIDLPRMIDIVIGSRADNMCTHVEALPQRGFRLWRSRHAFLREYANIEIDGPGVLLGERS